LLGEVRKIKIKKITHKKINAFLQRNILYIEDTRVSLFIRVVFESVFTYTFIRILLYDESHEENIRPNTGLTALQ